MKGVSGVGCQVLVKTFLYQHPAPDTRHLIAMKSRVIIPRELLLVEIERRCPDEACQARTRIGLTKEEARAYCGFECERCEHRWDDVLTERDIPEWWEEMVKQNSGVRIQNSE